MKQRTILDLHDRYIGHKKFAKICDLLINKGHKVENIKEYNEKFKFTIDGFNFEYRKDWKSTAKDYVNYFLNVLDLKIKIKQHDTKDIYIG